MIIYKMKCGHANNAVTGDGKPACAICECTEIERECKGNEGLEGREARCSYYGKNCHSKTASSWDLAFFSHRPDKEYDEYYCGCWGWD